MSSLEDADAILTFLQTCFLDTAGDEPPLSAATSASDRLSSSHKAGEQLLSLDAHCSHAVPCTAHRESARSVAVAERGTSSFKSDADKPATPSPATAATSGLSSSHNDSAQKLLQQLQKASQVLPQEPPRRQHRVQGNSREADQAVTALHLHHSDGKQEAASEAAVPGAYAWLQQLPWVRCGDTVTAWTASELQSQRLRSHSQASTSQGAHTHDERSEAGCMQQGCSRSGAGQQPFHGQSHDELRAHAQLDLQSVRSARPMPPDVDSQTVSRQAMKGHLDSCSESQGAVSSEQRLKPSPALNSDCHSNVHLDRSSDSTSEAQSDSQPDLHGSQGSMEGIWVYPIKSCGGVGVRQWPLGPNGLLLDREWALVGDDGHVLTQKGLPRLALIQPRVNLQSGVMQVCRRSFDCV